MPDNTHNPDRIAAEPEILAFYTSIMRGEDEGASVTNRISAADKLLGQHMADKSVNAALGKLDLLLDELRCAVADHTVVVGECPSPDTDADPDALPGGGFSELYADGADFDDDTSDFDDGEDCDASDC